MEGTAAGVIGWSAVWVAAWFSQANAEPFRVSRVTTRDITDFRDGLRRQQTQAVATINRALVTLRRFFGWLVDNSHTRSTR